jgi:nicotinamidase-related amidase
MIRLKLKNLLRLVALGMPFLGAPLPAGAQTVIDQWKNIALPPAPALQSVTIDPASTVVLALDIVPKICAPKARCRASLPKIEAFLTEARAHDVPIIYSTVPEVPTADIYAGLSPRKSDQYVSAYPADKFIGTDLATLLESHHVKSVVVLGVTAEGSVLYTASHAAFLGYKVIDPVDGSSSHAAFPEAVTAWMLSSAPVIRDQTVLTDFSMIHWK